jgi:hypothetical protein
MLGVGGGGSEDSWSTVYISATREAKLVLRCLLREMGLRLGTERMLAWQRFLVATLVVPIPSTAAVGFNAEGGA